MRSRITSAGWRRSIVINFIGAIVTGIVLIVVIASKFGEGAWLSILIMALLVPIFYSIHRHYMTVKTQLRTAGVQPGQPGTNHVVLLVRDLDAATAEAVGYVRSFRPEDVRPITPVKGGLVPPELQERWRVLGMRAVVEGERNRGLLGRDPDEAPERQRARREDSLHQLLGTGDGPRAQ